MDLDHYDSAQVWLNKIHRRESYRKPSLFAYFLTARQAEIYYYNNLRGLGMQEALRARHVATVLNDSILLLDAQNFIGLFHMMAGQYEDAVSQFRLGLVFTRAAKENNASGYIPLSRPLHLYGNLAEAFEKLRQTDSAIFYSKKSLDEANRSENLRGMATATLNLSFAYLVSGEVNRSARLFAEVVDHAAKGKDFDVELAGYGGLATCAAQRSDRLEALHQLSRGFTLLGNYPQLNDFYKGIFLRHAEAIYRQYDEEDALIKTLDTKSKLLEATYTRNNRQLQTLLNSGLENEKRILDLELAEARASQQLANRRLYIALLVVLLVVVMFAAYRYFLRERLRLSSLRNKISQDLHDEVGATLSGIAMYSHITEEEVKKARYDEATHLIGLIKGNASTMVSTLSDIVWAVNPVQDTLHALLQRLKDFAFPLTSAAHISLLIDWDDSLVSVRLPMEHRKNIYLIGKEAINNAVKHSGCSTIRVDVDLMVKQLRLKVEDDGVGFESSAPQPGNGMVNMADRADQIRAVLKVVSRTGTGTTIHLECPITQ